MGNKPTKAADSIYCICRKSAAAGNDRLYSREGAAELLGVSASSLADYELGNTKVVPVDKVILMADLYNSPELKNYYCANDCPIGRLSMVQLEVSELCKATLQVLNAFKNVEFIEEALLDIAADGVVTKDETERLASVLGGLNTISIRAQELKLWAEKNMN